MCDQAKAVLIQNCYLAVSLGLQPKKSPDEYAAQGVGQTRQGRLYMLDGGMICLPDPDTLLKVGKTRHLAYPTLFRMQWKTILKDHVKELFHSSPPKWRTLCHCVSVIVSVDLMANVLILLYSWEGIVAGKIVLKT